MTSKIIHRILLIFCILKSYRCSLPQIIDRAYRFTICETNRNQKHVLERELGIPYYFFRLAQISCSAFCTVPFVNAPTSWTEIRGTQCLNTVGLTRLNGNLQTLSQIVTNRGLLFKNIESSAGDFATLKRFNQSKLVNDCTSGSVYDKDTICNKYLSRRPKKWEMSQVPFIFSNSLADKRCRVAGVSGQLTDITSEVRSSSSKSTYEAPAAFSSVKTIRLGQIDSL